MEIYQNRSVCRSCNSPDLREHMQFGSTPLSDRLLKEIPHNGEEIKVPLTLLSCNECSLVQIKEEVNPVVLFQEDYRYYSSVSKSLMDHFEKSARDIIASQNLDQSSFVVEAASNDGYMLKHFARRGIKVLGIDPAQGPAKVAEDNGIPTVIDFFGSDLARELTGQYGKADLFLGNNVLAHVPDLNGFVEGIKIMLKDDAMAVIEVPYLLDLIEKCEFDTIYHQHLCYFSITALQSLFNRHGLYLNDLKHVSVHGGTIRMFIQPFKNISKNVEEYLEKEKALGMKSPAFYDDFVKKIKILRSELLRLLEQLKGENKRIVGYGAAAKANTLLSYFGIGKNYLDYIVDSSKYKHGLYFSGNHLPIVPPERLKEDQPDYVLLLAWNFADEIINQQEEYKNKGGNFIIPIPEVKIV